MSSSHQFFNELSENMGELLETGANYDVEVQIGDDINAKKFRVHSVILAARCPYFRSVLSSKWTRKSGDVFIFKKTNISPETFKEILKYIYTGVIDLDQKSGTEIIKILVASEELFLQKVVTVIKQYLFDHQSEFLTSDPIRFFQTVFLYDACKPLRDFCLQEICENPQIIFGSSDYLRFNKTLLSHILRRDDLVMEEIEIWMNILKWSLAQNSLNVTLNELNHLSDQDFIVLKETMKDLIPYIRWAYISPSDFLHLIHPFGRLLPGTLYEQILSFYLDSGYRPSALIVPPRKGPYIDSILLDQHHIGILSSWIDYENIPYDKNNNPYNFKLLLRASRDGFDPSSFHRLCDNKGATIMVTKLSSSNQLIGGYNPLFWSSRPIIHENQDISSSSSSLSSSSSSHNNTNNDNNDESWWVTKDSFLFSFHNKDYKIARVHQQKHAIYYNHKCGPGWGCSGDLIIKDSGSIYNSQNSTSYPDASKFFPYTKSAKYDKYYKYNIDDYEVFQITKKPGCKVNKNRTNKFMRFFANQNWKNFIYRFIILILITGMIYMLIKRYEISLEVLKNGLWKICQGQHKKAFFCRIYNS
ncbi:hypothetical protein Glove_341g24 [Diversispora epigaea]|uniref:BTB domain-containing protein n=1 Tax=Diversispora epigaea TaxID=1348612 RepID=A0A397HKV6_9GLOM|nr:hypothetical protein Glove_341g24 [Diversispora epigaea]